MTTGASEAKDPAVILRKVEWGIACVLTVLAVSLHIVFLRHAGGLWRDEVSSLHLATLPSLADVWSFLEYDSFPALWPLALRGWVYSFGATDASLRFFGCLVGLAIMAALWLNARLAGYRFPILTIALFALNPMVIRYGDSIRGYGLGILFMVLTFSAIWRATKTGSLRWIILAGASAVLSVHTLYYNWVLLAACCGGAAAVTGRAGLWRRAAALMGVGVVAGLSVLPYLPKRSRGGWDMLSKLPVTIPWLWGKLSEVLGAAQGYMVWIWVAVLVLGFVGADWALFYRPARNDLEHRTKLVAFSTVALVLGMAGYLAFLKALQYVTQPWYYIVLMGFGAVCLEAILASVVAKSVVSRILLSGGALLIAVLSYLPALHEVRERQTNIDLIATELQRKAAKDDFIVVNPWYCGITFRHYFHGDTPWDTVPPIENLNFHRYDLLMTKMTSDDPVRPLLERIAATLKSGHRVWLVGGAAFLPPGQSPSRLPPAPNGPSGWHDGPYLMGWSMQVGYFVQSHAMHWQHVLTEPHPAVNAYEDSPLLVLEGWR